MKLFYSNIKHKRTVYETRSKQLNNITFSQSGITCTPSTLGNNITTNHVMNCHHCINNKFSDKGKVCTQCALQRLRLYENNGASESNSKGPFTRTVSVPVSVTVKVYHCVNGEGLFDSQTGFGTHSACQCKFEGDRDEDGNGDETCKQTLIVGEKHGNGCINLSMAV